MCWISCCGTMIANIPCLFDRIPSIGLGLSTARPRDWKFKLFITNAPFCIKFCTWYKHIYVYAQHFHLNSIELYTWWIDGQQVKTMMTRYLNIMICTSIPCYFIPIMYQLLNETFQLYKRCIIICNWIKNCTQNLINRYIDDFRMML